MSSLRYFEKADFDCQESQENEMSDEFLATLDELRDRCGFPFIVTSGYISATHSAEINKEKPGTGTHCQGVACDIKVQGGAQRRLIVKQALSMGMSVGVAKTFVHVDTRQTTPVLWCY